jgi:hypothetical protein
MEMGPWKGGKREGKERVLGRVNFNKAQYMYVWNVTERPLLCKINELIQKKKKRKRSFMILIANW